MLDGLGANLCCVVLPIAASRFPAASGQNVLKIRTSLWTDDGKMRLGARPGSSVSIQELFTRQHSEHLTGGLAESRRFDVALFGCEDTHTSLLEEDGEL